jgi:predicted permease
MRETLQRDFWYATRRLAREPGFAATAILILAVGIGACTAMFSIVQAVLLRPFGVDAPKRVVMIWTGNTHDQTVGELTYKVYRDLRVRMRSFEDVAIVGSVNWWGTMSVAGGEPFGMPCSVVSATFFDVLGARPLLGRTFRAEDDEPSAARVLVLSHAAWTQHFGADPQVIGRKVIVREEAPAEPFEIVGVMREEFFFPRGAKYWTPAAPRLARIARDRGEPIARWFDQVGVFYALARFDTGATIDTTRSEAAVLLTTIGEELKADLSDTRLVLTPILDHIFGPARPALLVLLGAVVMVLLVACFNVAGLSFARGAARIREMAVRAALGASRRVLVRQLLVESALIAVSGAVVGVAVAALTLDSLVALSPADIPRLEATTLDGRVLVFALAVAIVTTMVVGLAPAVHLSRPSLVDTFKGTETGVVSRAGRARMRRVLTAAQMAATVVLLVAAGLCVQSFARLSRLDLGFDPSNILTFNIKGLDETRYPTRSQRHDAIEALLTRIARVPHVTAAGAIYQRPFEHGPIGMDTGFLLEGQSDTPDSWNRNPVLNWESVASDYFRSMGIRLIRGRIFDKGDTSVSPLVAIVSEAMAARVWPGESAIGKRLRTLATEGADTGRPQWHTIVGVVATARYREIENPRLDLYVPLRQTPSDVQHFTIRTAIDPVAVAPSIAAAIASFDKILTMGGVTTMEDIVGRTRGPWRFNMLVFGLFGGVALVLAAVGLFGLVAYEVAQRSREIGIRMALGAAQGHVVRLMVSEGTTPAAIGMVIGVLASLLVTRLLSGLLFDVRSTDPGTFGGAVVLLLAVALLASYVPARRAASVDPQAVLRDE